MVATAGFDPSTTIHSKQKFSLGEKYEYNGRTFRYYQAVDILWVVGWALCFGTVAGTATGDRAGGAQAGLRACGIACAAVPVNSYGFVQTGGRGLYALLTDGNIAATSILAAHATTDGGVLPGTAALIANHFGTATAADTTTALAIGDYILDID
jgi:hypothetical protein